MLKHTQEAPTVPLAPSEVLRIRQGLLERRQALCEIFRAELNATRREGYLELAGQVHDRGDESVAELLVGIDISGCERELNELNDIEAALMRITQGNFGSCADCHKDIQHGRLKAYPTAKRCTSCQQRHERYRRGGKDATPSL